MVLLGTKALNGSLGPGTRMKGTQMLGPKYRDPNSQVWNVRVSSAGTHHPGTKMKGPGYWDPSARNLSKLNLFFHWKVRNCHLRSLTSNLEI